MSAIHCQYHPAIPARWRCPQCKRPLCNQCAPRKADKNASLCPACQVPTQSLGIGNTIKPFWERIPRFFAYPAKADPLVTAFMISLPCLLAAIAPVLGLIAMLIGSIAGVRYCYRVLYHTALGNLEPPQGNASQEYANVFWKQVGLYFVLFGGVGLMAAATKSLALVTTLMVVIMLALPAATITLAVERRLGPALDPGQWLDVGRAIGKPYFLLWFMLVSLMGVQHFVIGLLGGKLPLALDLMLNQFVTLYFSIAMFHVMGYVVYQYHEPLHFHVALDYSESEEAAKDFGRVAAAPLDRAQILITEGNFEEAIVELEKKLLESPEDLNQHDRYFRLLLTQPSRKEAAAAHAQLYLGKLLKLRMHDRAFEVYRDSAARYAAPEIKVAEQALGLAAHAHRMGQSQPALQMLAHFPQRFSGHAKIPDALLLSAEILTHGLGKDEMALRILGQLQQAYPSHPLRPRFDSLVATVERLLQRKAALNQKSA